MKHIRVFHMLRVHGHSAQKAQEMIIAAKRKDARAMRWIRRVHNMQHRELWIARLHQSDQHELGKIVGWGKAN